MTFSSILPAAVSLALLSSLSGQTYSLGTVAGGSLPVDIPGLSASLGTLGAIAIDSNGNLFITSPDYNAVFRLDAKTRLVTLAAGNGIAGFAGDAGRATFAELNNPQGIAVDSAGDLFIADSQNNRIRKVSNGVITTIVGTGQYGGYGDGPALEIGLEVPYAVALDSQGNLYFTDGTPRVRRVTNGAVTTIAGSFVQGYSGDGGPSALALLNYPEGLAVDPLGNVYVADPLNHCVREISKGIITTVAGNGTLGYYIVDGPATSTPLSYPRGVAADPQGDLFVIEGGCISEVTKGIISGVTGCTGDGFSGDGGPALDAELAAPEWAAADSAGNLFIPDRFNARIREVSGGIINTIAGNGSGAAGDNGFATSAQLDRPNSLALDASGNLFIADTNNHRVRKVSNGVITTVAGNGGAGYSGDGGPAIKAQIGNLEAIAISPSGSLIVDDIPNIEEVSNGVINNVAGGSYEFANGLPAHQAGWKFVEALVTDSAGNLYLADAGDQRILEISNGIVNSIAGNGTYTFNGDGEPAVDAGLSWCAGVAVDAQGNVFIADTYNNRVREVSGGIITTVAGNGGGSLVGDGGPATQAEIDNPWGIAVDSTGSIYIAGNGDGRVRKVTGGIITTIAGGGDQTGDAPAATSAQLSGPTGLALDRTGRVFIAEPGSNRVRVLTPSGPPCSFAVTIPADSLSGSGAAVNGNVETGSACMWAIQSLPGWITVSGSMLRTGASTVALSAAANPGPERSAQVSIAGAVYTIRQSPGPTTLGTSGVTNAASYTATVAPGSISAIFGDFQLASPFGAVSFPIPTNVGSFSLTFSGGFLVPLFYAANNQVNGQIPWELAGQASTTITATINGENSIPQSVSVAAYAPGIFTTNGSGSGPGALISSTTPATEGSYLQIYCTGLGPVSNQPATGAPAPGYPLAETTTIPLVTVGGVPAPILFSGLTPGTVGLYQVNVQIPAGVTPGSAVEVTLSIGGVQSNVVTLAMQ